ncbi:MAG: glycosyltransferase family 4 protein [Methanomassiliicoccales archaeon]|nr:glycosyltransferase family 4 protein [Methanomassiliicoccales archaeon]
MKVLMVGERPKRDVDNGLENHIKNLLDNLQNTEDVDILFSSFLKSEIPWEKRTSLSFKISFDIPVRYLLSLSAFTRKFRPDILHVHGCSVSPYTYFQIFSPFDFKRVLTVHGITSQEAKGGNYGELPRMMSFLYELLEKYAYRRADRIIVLNNGKKKWISERHGKRIGDKTVVINNGVNMDTIAEISAIEGLREKQRSEIGVPNDSFVIFLAKGFVHCNGQEYLIRAMPDLVRSREDIKLVLAGDGPTMKPMKKLSEELGVASSIRFLGTIPNTEVLKQVFASDVMVLPSTRHGGVEEGFSIFLLESMAMGKPVVVTRVGGSLECIVDGQNGLLIPEEDSGAIVSSILRLHDDSELRERLGRRARTDVIERWTWQKNAESVHREYLKLISQDGSRTAT